MRKVIPMGLFCSDIHLSDEVPSARAETAKEWRAVQNEYLLSVVDLANKYKVPLFIAGDIFHTPEVSHQLLNDTMLSLDRCHAPVFAIAGNHDMPHHNYNNLQKSAYGSLAISGKIDNLDPFDKIVYTKAKRRIKVWGFPFGQELVSIEDEPDMINVAMVHKFCWFGKHTSHKKEDESSRADVLAKQLTGFKAAVFGDNHTGFLHERDVDIFNCGCMIPRRMPEQLLTPQVGLLHSDGRIKPIKLDTSKDKWKDKIEMPENPVTSNLDVYSIFEGMEALPKEAKVDYFEHVMQLIEQNDIRNEVKYIVSKTFEKARKELA